MMPIWIQQRFSTEERRELRASGEGLVSRSDPVQFCGENPELAGIGHFALHERDRRFESTLLRQPVLLQEETRRPMPRLFQEALLD
jgi:hypothetical protein